jgi:hypothetical protein
MAVLANPLLGRFGAAGPAASSSSAAREPTAPWPYDDPLQTLRSRLLATQDLLRPGFMSLHAIRRGGRVVDFVWSFASAAAGRMLGHNAVDLYGKRLSAVLAQDGSEAVFRHYRDVVEQGRASATQQVHHSLGSHDTFRHGAVRVGDGVAVTLINLSAARRARALELALLAQQAMTAAYTK